MFFFHTDMNTMDIIIKVIKGHLDLWWFKVIKTLRRINQETDYIQQRNVYLTENFGVRESHLGCE